MKNGVAKKDLIFMRSHYMRLAIKERNHKNASVKHSISWVHHKATMDAYRYMANGLNRFWPVILGVK